MRLSDVNALDQPGFVAALGGIVEHSPWIANAAWTRRPFASADALHAAMMDAMMAAPELKQLAMLRGHPELAGKAAIRGELTAESTTEQSGAGLTQCSPKEYTRLVTLNRAYNAKFGFPFIIAVKGLDRGAIIDQFDARVEHDRETEFREALKQIANISRMRLAALLET
jgi:2-oxo-4-hydroxy-4-carboxy-5-ureidoimidazoline decarboxylase